MDKLTPIKIPLLNPNEPEALLSSIEVQEGEAVKPDQVVAVIETTKSTGEVVAGAQGYLVGICFHPGDTVQAGDTLAYIADSPGARDESLPPWAPADKDVQKSNPEPGGLRITAPARELALKEGIALDALPHGPLVTAAMVREHLAHQPSQKARQRPDGENRLIIYGVGGHGRSLEALIRSLGTYHILGFLDDGYQAGEEVLGMKILGGLEKLPQLCADGICLAVNGIGGIGDPQSRLQTYEHLHASGFFCPTVIHPTAFIEDSAECSDGVQVLPFAYVGTHVTVGYGCIINTGVIISHDCVLAPYVNLSPGATLAGGVSVGEESLIGMRVTINLGVRIGRQARIGNGATVKADVPDGGVVPAGTIWPPRR
jgi:sugar O-acyltransferase (sialic acid O-acetyltransferase NeuD family)